MICLRLSLVLLAADLIIEPLPGSERHSYLISSSRESALVGQTQVYLRSSAFIAPRSPETCAHLFCLAWDTPNVLNVLRVSRHNEMLSS
jgi:hypothetical protein